MSSFIVEAKSNGEITDEERESLTEIRALIVNGIEGENPLSVASFLSICPALCPDQNKVYPETEGLTFQQ